MLKAAEQLHPGKEALSPLQLHPGEEALSPLQLVEIGGPMTLAGYLQCANSLASEALLISLMECAASQDGQSFCQYMVLAEMQSLGLEKRGLAGVEVGVWRGLVGESH